MNNWFRNRLFYRVQSANCFNIFCGIQICLFQCTFVGFLPKISKSLYYTFCTNITANQHLGVVNPNSLYILSVTIIMEQKQAANYDNLLLDNLNTSIPIDINHFINYPKILCNSTPSLLKNHQSEVSVKRTLPLIIPKLPK